MPCWPVSHRDGKYQVTDSDGILYPITMNRAPVESLQTGWYPIGLQTGLKPYHLLELHNDTGSVDAVWYLGDDLNYINNAPKHFTPEQAELVVSSLSPLLRDIHDQSLCAAQPDVAASSHDFDGINPLFIREIIGFVVATGLSPPEMVAARRLESMSSHYMAAGVRLSAALLRHSLDITAPPQPRQGLVLPSPFDGTPLTAQEQFALQDGVLSQAYRFHDPAGRLAFYLLFAASGAPALYIPMANTVFSSEDALTGAQVMTSLFSHYATHTDRAAQAATPFDEPEEPMPSDLGPEHEHPEPAAISPAASLPAAQPAPPAANWWKRLFGLGNP